MNTQRQAFLEDLEADLTAAAPKQSVERPRRSYRAGAAIAATAFAGLSFLSSAGMAAAAPVSVQASCFEPDHKPFDHVHFCGPTTTYFDYEYTYSPNGGITICYHFYVTYSGPCATGSGPKDSCAHS
ncbi:hypothetical protein [Actinocrispum sp. NPDC049592]|uniref:hypothetical protein n=1 Tax=Actinocrispum sp. NPDC049592 TaxID=3154835 RepID=UPI00342D9DB1